MEVGSEDLELLLSPGVISGFQESHGQRVGLLAAGTAHNPRSDRIVLSACKNFWKYLLL